MHVQPSRIKHKRVQHHDRRFVWIERADIAKLCVCDIPESDPIILRNDVHVRHNSRESPAKTSRKEGEEEGERYTEGKGAEGSAMRDGLERGKEKRTSLYFRQFRIEELDLRGG